MNGGSLSGALAGLALAALTEVLAVVQNLGVSGDGPESWSDGVWMRAAWRAMRTPR